MSKSKISYLNSTQIPSPFLSNSFLVSPYSRHSPSLQLKTGLKKQSNSVERPKSGKAYYAGSTTRGHTPINNPEIIDRKYSPFGDGKGDMGDSLRQFYKTKTTKEKPGSAKPSKAREIQAKKPLKSGVRPLDNRNEKLGIYHYVNSKSTKNLEDVRSHNPSMHMTPSRQGSRNNLHDEKDISHERRIPEAGIFQHKQLIEALEEMRKSKGKLTNSNVQNQSHSSLVNRASQKPPQSSSSGSGKVVQYSSVSLAKPKKEYEQPSRRPSEQQIKNNIFKDLKLASKKASEVIQQQPQPKEEIIMKQQEAHAAQKKHRRGLSSGQNPLFLEQQLAMEQLAMERERMKQMQLLQQQQLQQQQQQLLLQQQQQQMQQMQQMQLHMQNQYKDPQQEEDEFYEEFFHMDKMTFGFEKLMISQKEVVQNNSSTTPVASPSNGKNQSVQSSQQSGHHRTRSTGIEEQISMMPTTKSSSRWNTKKSSVDHHDQHGQGHERFNMLEHISEFDKSEIEKETMRRYYKQR